MASVNSAPTEIKVIFRISSIVTYTHLIIMYNIKVDISVNILLMGNSWYSKVLAFKAALHIYECNYKPQLNVAMNTTIYT